MVVLLCGCGGGAPPAAPASTTRPPVEAVVEGNYALGPVAFRGAEHLACGPYLPATEARYGVDLAGVGLRYGGQAELCDACIEIHSKVGTRVVARVVTYGETVEPGDVDLSAHAFQSVLRPDPSAPPARPRPMSWRIVACPDAAPLAVQFQTLANVDWTSFWVRNARWPITRVEVRSSRHARFTPLRRETDGTFNDDRGFGPGPFTLRIHTAREAPVEVSLDAITPGALVELPALRSRLTSLSLPE